MKKLLTVILLFSLVLVISGCKQQTNEPLTCDIGYSEVDGECVEDEVPLVCDEGFHVEDDECVEDPFERNELPGEIWYSGFEEANTIPDYWTGLADIVTGKTVDGELAAKQTATTADTRINTGIPEIANGRLSFSMMIDNQPDGEISVELRISSGRIFSLHLMPEGRIAYRTNYGQWGDRIPTTMAWTQGEYVNFVIEWYEDYTYDAFVVEDGVNYKITPEPIPFYENAYPTFIGTRTNYPRIEDGQTFDNLVAYYDNFVLQNASGLDSIEWVAAPASTEVPVVRDLITDQVQEDGTVAIKGIVDGDSTLFAYPVEEGSDAPTLETIKTATPISITAGRFDAQLTGLDKYGNYDIYIVTTNAVGDSEIFERLSRSTLTIIDITTYEDLLAVKDDLTATYRLKANIDATDMVWSPSGDAFEGIIFGNGFTISNLTVEGYLFYKFNGEIHDVNFDNILVNVANEGYGGLLGAKVSDGGTAVVENIRLNGVTLDVDANDKDTYAGLLFGRGYSAFDMNNVSVTGTVIVDIALGTEGKGSAYIGGLMGRQEGDMTITDLYTDIDLTYGVVEKPQTAGGVIGRQYGNLVINNAVLDFNIVAIKNVGAVSGKMESGATVTVNNAVVYGTYETTGESTGSVALLVGNPKTGSITITNVHSVTTLADMIEFGAAATTFQDILDFTASSEAINEVLDPTATVDQEAWWGIYVPTFDQEATWVFDGRLKLAVVEPVKEPVDVATLQELIDLLTADDKALVNLTADIDGGGATWSALDLFQGTLNGNGFTISNLVLETALFKDVNDAKFINVNFDNITINPGTAGYAGLLTRKVDSGPLTVDGLGVTNLVITVDQAKDTYFGGLVGRAYDVDMTFNNVSMQADFIADVQASNSTYAGGLIGRAGGSGGGANVSFTDIFLNVTFSENGLKPQMFGGLAGRVYANVTAERVVANVVVTGATAKNVGVLLGKLEGGEHVFTDVYTSGAIVSTNSNAGAFIANVNSKPVTFTNSFTELTVDDILVGGSATSDIQPNVTEGYTALADATVADVQTWWESSLPNFDFTTTWEWDTADNSPKLK